MTADALALIIPSLVLAAYIAADEWGKRKEQK